MIIDTRAESEYARNISAGTSLKANTNTNAFEHKFFLNVCLFLLKNQPNQYSYVWSESRNSPLFASLRFLHTDSGTPLGLHRLSFPKVISLTLSPVGTLKGPTLV